jgi:acyl dehydratase
VPGQTLGVALPSSTVGVSTEPITHEIDARWLMAYAGGVYDPAPFLLDTTRPDGIVAHALFPVCVEWPAVLALRRSLADRLPADERLKGVHATHDLIHHRSIRPGDELATTATVVSVERRRPGAYEVVRLDTVDPSGEPVATTYMGSLFLGVDVDDADRIDDQPPPLPDVGGPDDATSAEKELHIPATMAHIYTETARIWNPIHTDAAVAEAAGLPGIILHGTASLAMAVTTALETPGGRIDHSGVQRITARFGAMVTMPTTLHLTTRPDRTDPAHIHHLHLTNPAGDAVLRDTMVQLRPHATAVL